MTTEWLFFIFWIQVVDFFACICLYFIGVYTYKYARCNDFRGVLRVLVMNKILMSMLSLMFSTVTIVSKDRLIHVEKHPKASVVVESKKDDQPQDDKNNKNKLPSVLPAIKVDGVAEKNPFASEPPVHHEKYTHDTTARNHADIKARAFGTERDKYIDMGYRNDISAMKRINKRGDRIDFPGVAPDSCLV